MNVQIAVLLCAVMVAPAKDLAATVAQANASFVPAYQRGDFKAMAADFAPDGIYVSASHTIVGRTAIAAFFALRKGKAKLAGGTCQTDRLIVGSGMASELGHCTFRFAGKPPRDGKFLTVWRLSGGAWRIAMNAAM